MNVWKGLGQGFTGVADSQNACMHLKQRVKEEKYEPLQAQ